MLVARESFSAGSELVIAITVMPAANAASTPEAESSITQHSLGATSSNSAVRRKMSGAGLPCATSSELTTTRKKRRKPRMARTALMVEWREPDASASGQRGDNLDNN